MKISLLSLGCKVNQAEMADLESSLKGKGAEIVGLSDKPDICVINTCTVTAKSDYQSRQLIRRAARSSAWVMVTGCYSELHKESIKAMEGVEEVISNADKSNIINMIRPDIKSSPLIPATSRSRYFLKVQDGCDRYCSYCVIPLARGKPRSVEPERAISEVKRAVSEGYKEVVLTGIHLGLYGADVGMTLVGLLERIITETAVKRLRLSSLEINEIDERLLALFETGRICRHLHVPLQSGDDGILKAMKRGYDSGHFYNKIMQVMEVLGDIALGTDVIAGFPGEGEKEFENTLNLLNSLPFTYIHSFPYSPRPGTWAANLKETVPAGEKKKRVTLLKGLSERKRDAYMHAQIGKSLDALAEQQRPDGTYLGTSSNYLKVRFAAGHCPRRSVVSVRVVGVQEGCLLGERINST